MDYPITVDFGKNGGKRRFDNEADFQKFFTDERNSWNFITRIPNNNAAYALHQLYDKTIGAADNFRNQVYSQSRPPAALDALVNHLQSNLARSQFPLTFSPDGRTVQEIRAEYGDSFAIGYLAGMLDQRFDANEPAQFEGMMLARELKTATGRRAKATLQKSYNGFLERALKHQTELEAALQRIETKAANDAEQRNSDADKLSAEQKETLQGFVDTAQVRLEHIIETARNTDDTYKGFMTLKAPVTYWRHKGARHRRNTLFSQIVGLLYAGSALVALGFWVAPQLISAVETAIKKTGEWQISYIILAVSLVELTIVFWIGRLISRLYVSEQHLAVDAEERATMVMTYLALANDDKVTDAERAIVLASLFRPSADGLVRDDGAPDLSLAGVVSKLVATPTK